MGPENLKLSKRITWSDHNGLMKVHIIKQHYLKLFSNHLDSWTHPCYMVGQLRTALYNSWTVRNGCRIRLSNVQTVQSLDICKKHCPLHWLDSRKCPVQPSESWTVENMLSNHQTRHIFKQLDSWT